MLRLDEIVVRLGGEVRGDGSVSIRRIAPIESAIEGDICFLANAKFQPLLATTKASAVIVAPHLAESCSVSAILHPEPYIYFARLAQWLNPPEPASSGIHPNATVLSVIPASVSVGAGAFIGESCVIGEGAVIAANCSIGNKVSIGAETRLYPNVTIYHGCTIGQRCIIHSAAVIGSDGFGYAREKSGAWVKIPQTGGVLIGDDVEIGAGTAIDRGALIDTVIEEGVKIDNQVHIAHNVRIGAHSALAGCVGIAGSTTIGKHCTFGGGTLISGHLELGDGVNVSGGTTITKNIPTAGTYTGTVPSMEHGKWLKNFARLRHLDSMADKIRALEARLNELESKND